MPFVIQPKQVEIRRVQIEKYDAKSGSTSVVDRQNAELIDKFQAGDEMKFHACISAFAYTPDEAVRAARKVFSGTWKFDRHEYGPTDIPEFEAAKPWILIRKTTTKFF
jgi:hypothetical protein